MEEGCSISLDEYIKEITNIKVENLLHPNLRGTWVECIEPDSEGSQFSAAGPIHCLIYIGNKFEVEINDEITREVTSKGIKAGLKLVYILSNGTIRSGLQADKLRLSGDSGFGFAADVTINVDEPKKFYQNVVKMENHFSNYKMSELIRERMYRVMIDEFKEKSADELDQMAKDQLADDIRNLLHKESRSDNLLEEGLSIQKIEIKAWRILSGK